MATLRSTALAAFTGLAGAKALGWAQRVERRLAHGGPLLYEPAAIAARLAGRHLGKLPGPVASARLGGLLRWSWATALVLLRDAIEARASIKPATGLLGLASGVWAFELALLPALGATPKLAAWPRRQLATLWLHTAVFAAVTEALLRAGAAPGAPRPQGRR